MSLIGDHIPVTGGPDARKGALPLATRRTRRTLILSITVST